MVQDGAKWCRMVQDGARWCRMVQDGVKYAEYAEHAEYLTYDGAYHCPVGSIWLFLSNIFFWYATKIISTIGYAGVLKNPAF